MPHAAVQDLDPARTGAAARAAWAAVLIASDLPEILLTLAGAAPPGWLPGAKLGVLALFAAASVVWAPLRPLRRFFTVLLALILALRATQWLGATAWWRDAFSYEGVSFVRGFAGLYVLDTAVALAVMAALLWPRRRREEAFLVSGRLDAPVEPVRWLGVGTGGSWRSFGWIVAVVACLAVAVPTILAMRPAPVALVRALALLPACALFAAINAFNEEVYYRASFLATLEGVMGRQQLLLLTAVFFGLAHYLAGSPPGIVGALMTGFLGWLLAKGMLETRGIGWPWLIHFLADVVVFYSYAIQRV